MRLGRLFILAIASLLCQEIFAQQKSAIPFDSAEILQPVEVRAKIQRKQMRGTKTVVPQKIHKQLYANNSLSRLLAQKSSMYFKEYGSGMLSTVSFRGTSASQTNVLWNNFSIGSYTLGQMDFSLLPTVATDEITIIPGSGSNQGGSGAFGGAVLLDNTLKNENFLTLNQSFGSFNHFQSSLNGEIRLNNLSLNTKLYRISADNDFPILGTDRRQSNAAFWQHGIVQLAQYRIDEAQKLEAQVWYHDQFREIQPVIDGSVDRNEQEDTNFRSTIQYSADGERIKTAIGTGYFNDYLNYIDGNASIPYVVNRWESFANVQFDLNQTESLSLDYRQNLIQADNENYSEGSSSENRFSLNVNYSGNLFNKLNYSLQLKQQFVSGNEIPLNPYLGFDWRIYDDLFNTVEIKASTSYNYRLPTLNDRFYRDLGVPDILAETAFNKEAGVHYRFQNGSTNLKLSSTFFHNHVDNWIQWVQEGGLRPRNIKEVLAMGIENELEIKRRITNNLQLQAGSSYSHISSTVIASEFSDEVGKQLIYTPKNRINSFLNVIYRGFDFRFNWQYNGIVYTKALNTALFTLSDFNLIDTGVSYTWKSFAVDLTVKNLFNENYQLYSGFAQPGRNYSINLTYKFKEK